MYNQIKTHGKACQYDEANKTVEIKAEEIGYMK
jgi:hypothetical protein